MNNGNNQNQNPNRRFLGKVKNQNGPHGVFQKIYIDNPNPTNPDNTPNPYNKGVLLWCDAETGKKYQIKQLSVKGVGQSAMQKGFTNSICIDLDNAYEVQELG